MDILDTTIAALSEADLKEAILNLKAFDESPVPAQGTFWRVIQTLVTAGHSEANAIGFARYALLRAAAYRWAGDSQA